MQQTCIYAHLIKPYFYPQVSMLWQVLPMWCMSWWERRSWYEVC